MPASYRAAQGPKDKSNLPHTLTTAVVNNQGLGRLLEGCVESLWDSVVSAFHWEGDFKKSCYLPGGQEGKVLTGQFVISCFLWRKALVPLVSSPPPQT